MVAAGVGGLVLVAVEPFVDQFFGTGSYRVRLTAAALAAGSVLWAADYFGFIAAPYSESTLGLREAGSPDTPGVSPLVLASTARVDEHHEQIADFLQRVMNVNADLWFLSDESTIWDLHWDKDDREFLRRTHEIYGVDISDLDPPYLWRIAERIRQNTAT